MTMYDKIARMKPEQTNHWIEIPELSYWGERFFAEFSVAEALAQPEEMALLEQGVVHAGFVVKALGPRGRNQL